jgi:hypothetical protein
VAFGFCSCPAPLKTALDGKKMTEKSLKEILQEQRKYANYFECPDKQIKEHGVVECLLESMGKDGVIPFIGLRPGPSPNQAPDCIAEDEAGAMIAIEVTELVSRKAIAMNQICKNVYRNWKPEEVINEVQNIITRKDCVTYFGGPYSKTILVIHIDEITLDHQTYSTILPKASFKAQKIDEVFFLFSYRPQMKTYPYIMLKIPSNQPLQPIR